MIMSSLHSHVLACALIVLSGLLTTTAHAADVDPRAAATLVLYNSSDPTSQTMARFYASKRGVPDDQVVGLACPIGEEIQREEFERTIVLPLRKIFYQRGWWQVENSGNNGLMAVRNKIRFVAVIRGIPLKVTPRQLVPQGGPTPRPIPGITAPSNIPGAPKPHSLPGFPTPTPTPTPPPPKPMERQEAAVDSELACLGLLSIPLEGSIPNPYYDSYKMIQDANLAPIMLVTRLDGPNLLTVRNMLLDSLAAEREGIGGVAYFDVRNLKQGGYVEGDRWILKAAEEFQRKGVPTLIDRRPDTFPPGYDLKDAGFYLGWYRQHVFGPFSEPEFKFRRGAVAVHLHSFSGATIRNPTQYWVAPLLERGAAATIGNVYEPYLHLTPHLDIFAERLLAGFTFAEAAYMSLKGLSWMTTVVGDPLYRPYKSWSLLLDDSSPESDQAFWEKFRKDLREWRQSGHDKDPEFPSDPQLRGLYLETMAATLWAEGRPNRALRLLTEATKLYTRQPDKIRALFQSAQIRLEVDGKPAAIKFLQSWIETFRDSPHVRPLVKYELELNPPPPPPTPEPGAATAKPPAN